MLDIKNNFNIFYELALPISRIMSLEMLGNYTVTSANHTLFSKATFALTAAITAACFQQTISGIHEIYQYYRGDHSKKEQDSPLNNLSLSIIWGVGFGEIFKSFFVENGFQSIAFFNNRAAINLGAMTATLAGICAPTGKLNTFAAALTSTMVFLTIMQARPEAFSSLEPESLFLLGGTAAAAASTLAPSKRSHLTLASIASTSVLNHLLL